MDEVRDYKEEQTETATAAETETVTATRTETVTADKAETATAAKTETATADKTETATAAETGTDNTTGGKAVTNWKKELLSWVAIIVVAYVLAFSITHFIIMKTEIISGSMIATLNIDDRVIGNRMAYWFSDPERGDIIFFAYPDDESKVYVKRIIGLPGETVHIRGGQVYINDSTEPLDEPYLNEAMEVEPDADFEVPENGYFVMGDNRNVSMDARYWKTKYVTRSQIYAKAWLKYSPELELIESADYD